MEISNIDELLTSDMPGQRQESPETHEEQTDADDNTEDNSDLSEQHADEPESSDDSDAAESADSKDSESDDEDDYGNKKPVDNEVIRERLKKQAESLERKHQAELQALRQQLAVEGASKEVQQAAKDFEYNPEAGGDWQHQLREFVKHTVTTMGHEEQQKQMKSREIAAQHEFESKFRAGMEHFDDFVDVVGAQPITDAMTIATRAMKDPAAFMYAAAKRHPEELKRISNMPDHYVQMVEMGKLEERMRKGRVTTSAPKPMSRTAEDAAIPHKSDPKAPTIEELIAKSEAKKMAMLKARRR